MERIAWRRRSRIINQGKYEASLPGAVASAQRSPPTRTVGRTGRGETARICRIPGRRCVARRHAMVTLMRRPLRLRILRFEQNEK